MPVKVKSLHWFHGKLSDSGEPYFYRAVSPLGGEYKVWRDGALWVPTEAEYSQHGSVDEAKVAAFLHLENCVRAAIEEEE